MHVASVFDFTHLCVLIYAVCACMHGSCVLHTSFMQHGAMHDAMHASIHASTHASVHTSTHACGFVCCTHVPLKGELFKFAMKHDIQIVNKKWLSDSVRDKFSQVSIRPRARARSHARFCVCTCMFACICFCMLVCMGASMRGCMCAWTHACVDACVHGQLE